MKSFKEFNEDNLQEIDFQKWLGKTLDRKLNSKKYAKAIRVYLDWRKKHPKQGSMGLSKAAGITGVDIKQLQRVLHQMIDAGKLPKHLATNPNMLKKENVQEGPGGSESWEAGFKRRVVKTTKPEHKEKGYNWRIKGKERPEVTIKLYKSKPDFAEFKKQMKRVAGHEFGG